MVDCRNIKLPSIKCLTPSKQLTANWQHQLQQQPTSLCIVITTEYDGNNKSTSNHPNLHGTATPTKTRNKHRPHCHHCHNHMAWDETPFTLTNQEPTPPSIMTSPTTPHQQPFRHCWHCKDITTQPLALHQQWYQPQQRQSHHASSAAITSGAATELSFTAESTMTATTS